MISNEIVTIAITMVDDKLALMDFTTKQQRNGADPGWTREATPEEVRKELIKAGVQAKSWRFIDRNELPSDETFRRAWQDVGGKIIHNMPVARGIRLAQLRHARIKRLEQLDIEWMKAVGQRRSNDAARIEAQRQNLRDFPQALHNQIQAAATPEELKQIVLE